MSAKFEQLSEARKAGQAAGIFPDWYTTQAYQLFMENYSVEGEEGLKGRHQTIAKTLAKYMGTEAAKWEEKFFEIMWKGWFGPSTPVLANTGTNRGLPVSCSGQYVGDSINSFYENLHEAAVLSKYGFGCSNDVSDVRCRGSEISVGGEASGATPVIRDFSTMAANVTQGSQRRGAVASYLPIDHGDFEETLAFLEAEPDGLNIGWKVSNAFVERLKAGDKDANDRFKKALKTKLVTGRGYFFFQDKANLLRPQMYKDLGLDIKANLCTEILLHSSEEYTYTCVLSSMNLVKWDEYKDTDAIFTATVFLDCVVSYFLDRAKALGLKVMDKAIRFTEKGRAIGLGVMGFSSLLQKRRIPFESFEAHTLNQQIFKKLQSESEKASRVLAGLHGEPEWCKGYGLRNTHRTAVAPTKSNALLIGGVSESVFPDPGMVFELGSAAGGMKRISAEFYKLAKERDKYNEELVKDINQKVGSVQHLDWLTDHEKAVFRTAFEVDQEAILRLASTRQKYLCQGQSLNFFVGEEGDEKRIAALHSKAFMDPWITALYYIYSRSGVVINTDCLACSA